MGQLSARSKTIEEMEHNYEGYNGAVRFIMKSDLRGIRGVVADLINVPEGYETAIETALGGSLQNIVCDEDADAREAIRSLKKNKAGRMTFLPIASIHADKRRDEKLRSESGFIGFGPDCVRYDPEYGQIIEYLLGRVILVDHIDNAIRISKKSRGTRVVTLDGEIINSAGAITGGRYRNKTADILERKAEIRSLQEQIRTLTESGEKKKEQLESLLARTQKLGEESSDLEGQIRAGEHELLIHDQEIVLAEAALSDFRSSEEKISREMESIRQEMEHSAEVIEKLRLSIDENEKRKKQITEESEQMLRQKEDRQADFDEISEAITKARIVGRNVI